MFSPGEARVERRGGRGWTRVAAGHTTPQFYLPCPLPPATRSPPLLSALHVSLSQRLERPTDRHQPTDQKVPQHNFPFSVLISVGFSILGESKCHRADSLPIRETLLHKTTWTKTTLDSSSSDCGQLSNIEVANVSSSSPRGKPKRL